MIESLTIPADEVAATLSKRRIDERPPSIRSEAQRDRDRILYSSAFLRLGHVTQVASPEAGHIFHSRLTHSIKVGQVARGLAQRLKVLAEREELDGAASRLVALLDEDATEAAALAHDLGHPPFGHLAEKVLERMAGAASFEGNAQSFRIVTRLALRTDSITEDGAPIGLNLTRRTQNGLLKYPWLRGEEEGRAEKWGAYNDSDRKAFEWTRTGYPDGERTLEACLMDWADDVTYAVHDMDDFYRAGLIPLERLGAPQSTELGRFKAYLEGRAETGPDAARLVEAADRLFAEGLISLDLPFGGLTDERVGLRRLGSKLIGIYIGAPRLADAGDGTVSLEIDDHIVDQVMVLKQLTWYYVINRPSLSVIQRGQQEIIERLFDMYREAVAKDEPHLLPPLAAERIEKARGEASQERVIIDLIAGMTEAEASEIYRRRFAMIDGSVLSRVAGPV
ncbi:MAG: dNTP triphosphohydrolase [Actinobacteria bacterium]|nr:dNTP triphosphohydrolase [Actinomycetota bacterium]